MRQTFPLRRFFFLNQDFKIFAGCGVLELESRNTEIHGCVLIRMGMIYEIPLPTFVLVGKLVNYCYSLEED